MRISLLLFTDLNTFLHFYSFILNNNMKIRFTFHSQLYLKYNSLYFIPNLLKKLKSIII